MLGRVENNSARWWGLLKHWQLSSFTCHQSKSHTWCDIGNASGTATHLAFIDTNYNFDLTLINPSPNNGIILIIWAT